MKKAKLFITGAAGTAGRSLTKLAISNYRIGGTFHQNIPNDLKSLINQGLLKKYQVDLRSQTDIINVIQDFQPDIVIHLAGKVLGSSDKRVFDYSIYEENISIFKNILQAIKSLNHLPRFILSSGCLIYNKQVSSSFVKEKSILDIPAIDPIKEPYRASKADQEKILIKENKLDYIIVRPTQFTGPGKIPGVIEWYIASEILKIKKGLTREIRVKNKLGEVDILDVRDMASALLTLTSKGIRGEVYHISSGSPTTIELVAKILLEISGLNTSNHSIISADKEYPTYCRFSPEKLKKLGWGIKYNLKDTLTNYWEYFKNQERQNEIL